MSDALARPTPQQIAWHDGEIGMFVHFDVPVYANTQGGTGVEGNFDLTQFNPSKLDTEQWCDVAESIGAKYIIHVAKHYSGFCNWQTDSTDYSIRNTPWRGGKGDIVADLAESCRNRGLGLGIYLSPGDQHHGALPGGVCPNRDAQSRYNDIYRRQLTELLTKYGPIMELWFDGSIVVPIEDIVEEHAPGVICFQGPCANIRWPGSEKGILPYPAWNAVKRRDAVTGKVTAVHGTPDGDCWLPLEVDTPIRDHFWFHNDGGEQYLKSLQQLIDVYYQSVGYGGVLLLNSNPDRSGLIPAADAARAAEFGAEIRKRFACPLAEVAGNGDEVLLPLARPEMVDHVVIMEDIRNGERIRQYVIEGLTEGGWRELCTGSAVGHKKIDCFEPKTVSSIRFRCMEKAGPVSVKKLAAYSVGSVPLFDKDSLSLVNPISVADLEIAPGSKEYTVDLTAACRIPQRYEVELFSHSSHGGFRVVQAELLVDGTSKSDAIVPMSSDKVLDLKITDWCPTEILLRMRIEADIHLAASVMVR